MKEYALYPHLISLTFSKIFFIFIFCLLLVSAFFITPYEDSFYYWDWGRHLALSYFDGPPLIAYSMRLFTMSFGNTIYAINFLGIITIYLTLFFIYKTSLMLFHDKHTAMLAGILWIISPLTMQFQFLSVTYDNLLVVMWAATMYMMTRYIKHQNTQDIYLIGICCGLLLLSKYTGIILIFSFLLFILLNSKHWTLALNKHAYFSSFLAIGLFLPVMLWNYQHEWISFKYQFKAHLNNLPPIYSLVGHLSRIMEQLNLLFIFPLFAFFYYFKIIKQHQAFFFLYIIFFFTTLFLLNLSLHHKIAKHWLTPICISNVIIYSYFLTKFHLRKLFLLTVVTYILISLFYLLSYLFFQYQMDRASVYPILISKLNKIYHQYNLPVVTTSWQLASKLAFYLSDKPHVYSLGCGPTNEYNIWSVDFIKNVKNKKFKEVLYIDYSSQINAITMCINRFFTHCELLQTTSHMKTITELNIYRCYTND